MMLTQCTSSIIPVNFTEKSIELIQCYFRLFGERSKEEEKNVGASFSVSTTAHPPRCAQSEHAV